MSQYILDRAKRIESLVKEFGFPGNSHYERVVASGNAMSEALRDDMRSFMQIRGLYAHQEIFELTADSLDAYIEVGDSVIARLYKLLGKPVEKLEPRPKTTKTESETANRAPDASADDAQLERHAVPPLPRDPEYDEIYVKHEALEIARLAEDRRLLEESSGDYELYLAKQAAARKTRAEMYVAQQERERQARLEQQERDLQEQQKMREREADATAQKKKRDAEIARLEQQIKQLKEQSTSPKFNGSGFWGSLASGVAEVGLTMTKIRDLEQRIKILKAAR